MTRSAFGAIAGVDPSQQMTLVRSAIEATRANLECAMRDTATKQEAESLAAMLALTPAALEAR